MSIIQAVSFDENAIIRYMLRYYNQILSEIGIMKYLCLYELVQPEEGLKRMRKLAEISKQYKEEDKKMKSETPYMHADLTGGFQIIEADDFEHITELAIYYYGATNFKIIPIVELKRIVEIYEETKKSL